MNGDEDDLQLVQAKSKYGPFEFEVNDEYAHIECLVYDCPQQKCIVVEFILLSIELFRKARYYLILDHSDFSVCSDGKLELIPWIHNFSKFPRTCHVPKLFRDNNNDFMHHSSQKGLYSTFFQSHEWQHDWTLKIRDEKNLNIVMKNPKQAWNLPVCTWETPPQLHCDPVCSADKSLIVFTWKDYDQQRIQIFDWDTHTSYSFLKPARLPNYFVPVSGTLLRSSPWLVFLYSDKTEHGIYIRRKSDGKYKTTMQLPFRTDCAVLPGGLIVMCCYHKQEWRVISLLMDGLWHSDYMLACWLRMRKMTLFDGNLLFFIKSYL